MAKGRQIPEPVESINILDSSTWPEYMTLEEVALALRLVYSTVVHMIQKDAIPSMKFGRQLRVRKIDLLEFAHRRHGRTKTNRAPMRGIWAMDAKKEAQP